MQGTLQGAPGASPKELSTQELSIPHKGAADEDRKGINTALLIAKIIFQAVFAIVGCDATCMKDWRGHSREKEKKKRLDLNSPYLIKANLYFKYCFQHLHCLLILRTSFSSALNCDFEESGCRIMDAQPQGWEKACEEPWKLFTIVTEQHVMTKIKKHYIPARRLSVTIQVSLRTRAGTERRNLFTVNTSAWKYRARVTFCSQEDWH